MKKTISILTVFILALSMVPQPLSYAEEEGGAVKGEVLYSENFDGIEDGEVPEGWRKGRKGTFYVSEGKLVIDATGVEFGKILLPESLDSYGNYVIEADINFVSSSDTSRWASIVFRQTAEQNYYHMCVRRYTDATNGVEFAERYGDSWNVFTSGSADVKIDTTPTHIKVAVCGGTVLETVEGKDVIYATRIDTKNLYKDHGAIGFQANNSVVEIDNVVVTACTEIAPIKNNTSYTTYDFVNDNIVSRAAVVAEPSCIEEFEKYFTDEHMPNNIILPVDKDGNVPSLGLSFAEVYEKIKGKMVPVIKVSDSDGASWIATYLKENKIVDALICSDNPEYITLVHKKNPKVGGVLDCTANTDVSRDGLNNMVWTSNDSYAKICLISGEIATKEVVEYMQKRLITVWVAETTDVDAKLHGVIQTGANGIVTDNSAALYKAYEFYSDDTNVLVRNPLIIAHRGISTLAPDNTIESAKEAVKAGADVIELDVRLSKDGYVVLYHDDDMASLTGVSGNISKYTLEEIKTFSILRGSYGSFDKYPSCAIPTLAEFFEALKDDDVMFFIEIKENSTEICEKTAEVIEEYGMKDRCCMISFYEGVMTPFREAMPGVSCGFLMGEVTGVCTEAVVQEVASRVVKYSATYNPQNVTNPDVIRALMYRGITTWPWTFYDTSTFTAYLCGCGGVTTDYAHLCSGIPTGINVKCTGNSEVRPGDSVSYKASVETRATKFKGATPELVIVEGSDIVSVKGNTVKGLKEGTAYLMYRLTYTLTEASDGINYDCTIYSDLIEVTVSASAPAQPASLSPVVIILICVVALAAIAAGTMIIIRKKKVK